MIKIHIHTFARTVWLQIIYVIGVWLLSSDYCLLTCTIAWLILHKIFFWGGGEGGIFFTLWIFDCTSKKADDVQAEGKGSRRPAIQKRRRLSNQSQSQTRLVLIADCLRSLRSQVIQARLHLKKCFRTSYLATRSVACGVLASEEQSVWESTLFCTANQASKREKRYIRILWKSFDNAAVMNWTWTIYNFVLV